MSTQLATAASLKTIINAYSGVTEDWRESLAFAFRRLGSLLWLAFLIGLLVGVGFVLLIVPGVYLLAATSVAIPVLLVEGTPGWAAIGRSRQLVRGRWWHVFGALLVAYILSWAVNAVLGSVFAIGSFVSGDNSVTAVVIRDILASSIGGVLTTPFLAAAVALIYFDLRVRKENFDVEDLAAQVRPNGPSTA